MTAALIIAAATIFGPSHLDAGNPNSSMACGRAIYGEPRDLVLSTIAVASYLFPCGTWLRICAGAVCADAQVLDRGPRRARTCLDRFPDPKCAMPNPLRYDLDLSIALAVELAIGDWSGRPTRGCVPVGRGCAVTYSVVEARS